MGYHIEAYYLSGHHDAPEILASPDDVDALVDRLLELPAATNTAARYLMERTTLSSGFPDHEMYLAVDADLRVGAIRFTDADGTWATLGNPDGRADVRYHLAGHETIFPPHSDVRLDLVRQGGKEFLTSGGNRPECLTWQPVLDGPFAKG